MPYMNFETLFDKYPMSRYNNTDMEIYGKKQIDIREDNKSAVIDILLKRESTMPQMSEQLKLSHTALAKVINELRQKNVVVLSELRDSGAGRPPKLYGVNGDCAIACSVIVKRKAVYVYYVDMRGFQINKSDCENNFASLGDLLDYAAAQVKNLKKHPRLNEKILKNIYVGIPSAPLCGKTFSEASLAVSEKFGEEFPFAHTVARRNIDYEMIAESKYGVLNNGIKNAVLLNLDDYACASFMLGGNVYCGDNGMQGYEPENPFEGLISAFGADYENIAASYRRGELKAVSAVESCVGAQIERVGNVMRFLDVGEAVLSGKVCLLGDGFLEFCKSKLGGGVRVRYSAMGKDVPAALSGAVWQATYFTLQEVMMR